MPGSKLHRPSIVTAVLTLAAGIGIAWLDSRPGWDDTGVSAAAIFVAAGLGAFFGLAFAYAAALVALPILVTMIAGGASILLVVPISFVGALLGEFLRGRLIKPRSGAGIRA